jgi:unsaturated rhamnogalacturonyl hydrolase
MHFETWDWDSGVAMYGLMKAWEATGDQRYFDFVRAWVDGFIARGLPPITHPNHATPGLATLMLYEVTGQEKYLAAARQLATYLLHHAPRSAEGALYHYEDQLWVDTLFVATPFLARFSRDTGDPRYAEEAVRQFLLHARRLQDPETGIFFHGWDESEDSHMSAAFWERGNGWALAAGAELLDLLPADHPARSQIRDILVRQVEGLLPLQHESGLWHTVVNRPDFYLETSGAAAIGYALFRGLDQGWLDPAWVNPAAQLARHGVEAKVDWDGTVLDVSAGTGVAPTLEDYNGISHDTIQPWGQGLAMLLLSQRPYGFRLRVSPSVALVAPGETAQVTVAAADTYGPLPDGFDLTLSGAPQSVTWSFAPVEPLSARLMLTTTESTPPGSYPLTVSAEVGTLVRTSEFTLRVATQTYGVLLPLVAKQHDATQPYLVRLTDDPAKDWQPTLAPDGRLAFISDRDGAPHVYIQAPGDVPVRLQIPGSEKEDRPLFAADGRLAFSAHSRHSGWDVVIHTGAPWFWFPLRRPDSDELHPAISPDGRFMVYVSNQSGNWEIYVVELRVMDPQLTFHVASDRVPSWSPDGREIIFRSEWQGNSDIYVMDVEGRDLRRLTEDPAGDAWPSFSPDGKWILFQSDRAGNNDIYVMDRDGGQITQLTTHPAEDMTPSWSPDGRYILFASDRDGDFDIYRMPFTPPPPRRLYPNHVLANKIWQAVERFVEEHPPEEIYPGYDPGAGGPSAANARANVEAACHDFPDLPDLFGEGAHHRACYEWVAAYLGLYHAVKAWRTGSSEDIAWAQHHLDAALDYLAEFVYGPEDSPTGVGFRDTLAAMWQNPLRAINVTVTADLLRRQGALGAERQARVEELLSGIARAWYAEFWQTGQHPNSGVPFTVRTAPEVQAFSLAGRQVVSTFPWTFHWDADKGNTMAEEVAWMGAGVMLATRVLQHRLPDAAEIYAAARHYVDFAVSFDRPDPIHGGTVRSLNAETTGGAYGQRRYWFENHAPDMPSLPYMGYTWGSINAALWASELGDQQPWPELVPDDAQWDVLLRSAGETMRSADNTFLVDFTPGGGIGYNLADFPEWWVPCGQGRPGRQYVHYDGRAGGPSLFLSEIGHSAGLDMLLTGWPLMRIAAQRGDTGSYQVWEERLHRVLDEYIATPVNPGWAQCKTAPYVSANPGYHWARMLSVYLNAYLGASGYQVKPWEASR